MAKLTWCVVMVAVMVVASCAAPPAPDREPGADNETTTAPVEEPVVEEGFESGETGSLEAAEGPSETEGIEGQ
jgi:hypothetical protein